MGLLSEIRGAYHGLDKAVTKAERKALDIVVPKRDRKTAKELAVFLDRFAGMIASNAENTQTAPSFLGMVKEPFVTAKKDPTPWNLYAAGASALGVFPWGIKAHAGPDEWDSSRVPGARIRNIGSQTQPRYHFLRSGETSEAPGTHLNASMPAHGSSYIDYLLKAHDAPGGIVHDFIDPLINRYREHGAKIDASPINTVVAGTLLNAHTRDPGMIGGETVRKSERLIEQRIEQLNKVARNLESDPQSARWEATDLRQALIDDRQNPRQLQGALLAYQRHKRAMQQLAGEDEDAGIPDLSEGLFTLPEHLKRGEKYDKLWDRILDNDFWSAQDVLPVPRSSLENLSGSIGASVPAGAPRRASAPGQAFTASMYEARSQHTLEDWESLTDDARHAAAARASNGFPAHRDQMGRLRHDAREWHNRRNPFDSFDSYTAEDQYAIMRQFQAEQFRRGSGVSWEETPGEANRSAIDRATAAVMDALDQPRVRPEETLEDLGLTSRNSGDRLQASFEDFQSSRTRAAEVAERNVGSEEWNAMTPEDRDMLIRAQMRQTQREESQDRPPSRLSRAVTEILSPNETEDITSRAVRMAQADPDYYRWTDQERRAEARRIRGRLAHAERGGRTTPAQFAMAEARRAHEPAEWDALSLQEQRASVSRAQFGLPYRIQDYERMREEARRLDPRFSPEEFDALSTARQMSRVQRFFARRREDERGH